MVIISQKVQLWKVPRVQESLALNNEHTGLPLLPWDILSCMCLLFQLLPASVSSKLVLKIEGEAKEGNIPITFPGLKAQEV